MPAVEVSPASGAAVTAAAQALLRKNLIIKTAVFAPTTAAASNGLAIRTSTTLSILALPAAQVTLFLFPEYDRGDFIFAARNFIQWRLVGISAPDQITDEVGVLTGNFVPLTPPQVLPVESPVRVALPRGGWQTLAIEFDTSNGVPAGNQGEDRVIIDLSASS